MLVPTPFRRFQRVFFAFFASLAMVAQFVVALAPLDEGKEQRWGAHVEADGPVHHITHSEATCAPQRCSLPSSSGANATTNCATIAREAKKAKKTRWNRRNGVGTSICLLYTSDAADE